MEDDCLARHIDTQCQRACRNDQPQVTLAEQDFDPRYLLEFIAEWFKAQSEKGKNVRLSVHSVHSRMMNT